MVDKSQLQDSRNVKKHAPPSSPIIGKVRADKWDKQLDGLIVDLDINTAETLVIRDQAKSIARWSFVRDVILILLVMALIGLTLWRAMLTDQRLIGCGSDGSVSMSIPDKK